MFLRYTCYNKCFYFRCKVVVTIVQTIIKRFFTKSISCKVYFICSFTINNPFCKLPKVDETHISAWHIFVIQTKHRQALIKKLALDGIQTLIHYPKPCHLQTTYSSQSSYRANQPLVISELLSQQLLSIPMEPSMLDIEVDRVIASINQFKMWDVKWQSITTEFCTKLFKK